jgi:hypothetical protein
LLGAPFLAWLCCLPAAAQTPALQEDAADKPLVIRGVLAPGTTAFSGSVRLTATVKDPGELRLLPTELRAGTDPKAVIDRSSVAIPAGTRLDREQPQDVRVTVSNVQRPGTYKGSLRFQLAGQSGDALEVALELVVTARPVVKPVAPTLTLQLVRAGPLDGLAAWFLPRSALRDEWLVPLDNATLSNVELEGAVVVMTGEKTGDSVRADEVTAGVPRTLKAGQVTSVPLTFRRDQLAPEHYKGTVRFQVQGLDEPVSVNVDLSVRDGPLWPLVVVLLGVVLGRLSRGLSTPQAQLQGNLYPRYYRLRQEATRVRNPEAGARLDTDLAALERKISLGEADEATLTQEANQLETRIQFLAGLDELEVQLAANAQAAALAQQVLPQIREARQDALAGNIAHAQELRTQVEQRLRQVQQDQPMGAARDILAGALRVVQAAAPQAQQAAPTPPGGPRWNWLANFLAFLTGSSVAQARISYWLFRPLMFLVLLVLLVLLGMQSLYVNAGASFGVNGVYDYVGLLLWGMSADIAQRTLQNLPR